VLHHLAVAKGIAGAMDGGDQVAAGVQVAGFAPAADDEIHRRARLILGENDAALREVPKGSDIGQPAKCGRGKKGKKAVIAKEARIDLHIALWEEGGGIAEVQRARVALLPLLWSGFSYDRRRSRLSGVFFIVVYWKDFREGSTVLPDLIDANIVNAHRQ
jgi:hypothetical protein